MQLSKNFSLDELCVTNSGLPNLPNQEQINALTDLCTHVLQPLRDLYGKPIHINSGFRSALVNKSVGGVASSEHRFGRAADLDAGSIEENEKLFNLIKDHIPAYRQLINERGFSWVHVSYNKNDNKKQNLKL